MNKHAKKFWTDKDIRKMVQSLRKLYIPRPEFKKLDARFGALLEQRRADDADGVMFTARSIMLVGPSGSGKTTAVQQLVHKYRKLMATDHQEEICEYIGLQVPSPATMKFVGAATLRALGYPYSGNKQGPAIWDQVKEQLRLRRTLFLGFDEAQDLARFQTDKERQSVVNTLKSLMENSVWPVGLLLSGMPDLKKIVNQDAQLARRVDPIEIGRLHAVRDVDHVIKIVQRYADRARIEVTASVKNEAFAMRLMHAADYQFGLMAEIVVLAVSHALFTQGFEAKLSIRHFAEVYSERNGAESWMNVFIADDYGRLNPRKLLDDGEDPGDGEDA
ncbi:MULTISPECIES: TniB family NTP-binding protein [unclassified Ruegeria]|uniref:TniB family NTP-binding protein n=1 Tax=unclassified Ruegeria TaxID=2625375 RepID=UPI001ADB4E44|nr:MULTISPECIES: TniB family NTP-binding protein [unclassified Ruegeria]MBO9410762.1 TniB family NTP-binding protein [Ruegeria sp. R8_1]MBO9414963.1 TniB family NTP-binding protein [Ruegeria sp. R8_2]